MEPTDEERYWGLLFCLDAAHVQKSEYERNVYVLQKPDRSQVQIFRHLIPADYAWGLAYGPAMSRREF